MVSFTEPEKLALIFDGENRQQWQNTRYIMDTLNVGPGSIIADIGAGTGYFCQQFINNTPAEKIYAIDLEPNMLTYLQQRFANQPRIVCRACEPANPHLPDDVDTVFIANSYRFITERTEFLARLYEQLPQKARVIIVDFKGSNARVTPEMAMKEVISESFEIYHYDRDGCPDHYILSFRLPEQEQTIVDR